MENFFSIFRFWWPVSASASETPVSASASETSVSASASETSVSVSAPETLENSSSKSFEKTLKLLKELNVEPGKKFGETIIDEKKNQTLLHFVSEKGNAAVLKEILQEKIYLNLKAESKNFFRGCSPLHCTAIYGNEECLKILIENFAEINSKSENSYSPLHFAVENYKCLKILLENGANLNAKDGWNQTPLHLAASKGILESLNELIKNGADLNLKNDGGYSALHLAAGHGNFECLKALVEAGADLQLKNNMDQTALDEAIFKNKHDCIKFLKTKL